MTGRAPGSNAAVGREWETVGNGIISAGSMRFTKQRTIYLLFLAVPKQSYYLGEDPQAVRLQVVVEYVRCTDAFQGRVFIEAAPPTLILDLKEACVVQRHCVVYNPRYFP